MSIIIFIITLTLLIWRPRKLGLGSISLTAALFTLITRVITLDQIFSNYGFFTYPIFLILTFLGIDWILLKTRLIYQISQRLIPHLPTQGHQLFLLVLILVTITTPFLTNYGSLLLWTPLVLQTLILLQFPRQTILAFLTGIAFLADWSSLPFTNSNLLNAMGATLGNLTFNEFASIMFWVNGMTVITGIGVLCFYFWSAIPLYSPPLDLQKLLEISPEPYNIFAEKIQNFTPITPPEKPNIKDKIPSQFYFDPISGIVYTETPNHPPSHPLRSADPSQNNWWEISQDRFQSFWIQVLLFSLGINIISLGLIQEGFSQFLSGILGQLSGLGLSLSIFLTGFFITIQANIMNNYPTLFSQMLALQLAPITHLKIFDGIIYTAIISSIIGGKIFPLGSLSSLLWLGLLKNGGFHLSWRDYTKLALSLTLPVLFITLLALIFCLTFLST